jgi:hypothetical protein
MKVYESLCWIWDDYEASDYDIKNIGLYSTIELAKESIEKTYIDRISSTDEIITLNEMQKTREDDVFNLFVKSKRYEFRFRIIEREVI